MRCAIYTRVSTDNQVEKDYNSLETQKESLMAYIQAHKYEGWELYDVYEDAGYSAADLNRSELQRLLNDIRRKKINIVLVYKIDRLTRSPKDFYYLMEIFEKYKVDFISITERFDTSTPAGRLLRNIMLTFAQFERELASERTKDKMLERAKKGLWNGGLVPYGYKRENKRLIVNPKEADKWYEYWKNERMNWYKRLINHKEKIRFRKHSEDELSHYAKIAYDIEYNTPFGWKEWEGIHWRGDWDLSRHHKFSGEDLCVFKKYDKPVKIKKLVIKPRKDVIGKMFRSKAGEILKALNKIENVEEVAESLKHSGTYNLNGYQLTSECLEIEEIEEKVKGKYFIPHVIEPSYGADRLVYSVLENAYREKEGRVILCLRRDLAPIQAAVFPLVNKDGLPEKAMKIKNMLSEKGIKTAFML